MTWSELLKRPSTLLPFAMSLAMLGLVLASLALHGVSRQADEGAAAHLFQLLLMAQVPVVGYFALRWVPRDPAKGLIVLVAQLVALALPVITVAYLEW